MMTSFWYVTPLALPVFRVILYTITKKCLKLSPQNLKSRKLNPQRVLLGQEMRPNIKFDLIGLKLAEISSFENQYFSVQKNALQADSVQGAKKPSTGLQNHFKN